MRRVVDEESGESTGDKRHMGKKVSQRWSNRYRVVGEKHGLDSGDKVKHTDRNDRLFITRMMLVVERE